MKLGLASRADLTHFDKATCRRGKRAGQRYHAAFATVDIPPKPLEAMELWFAGANWAHQDGARVVFSVTHEDLEFFRECAVPAFWMTLVQVDDDEKPVNQVKLEALELSDPPATVLHEAAPIPDKVWDELPDAIDSHPQRIPEDVRPTTEQIERVKGGPRSKNVAMLCQDDEFCWYVSEKDDIDEKANFAQADAYVKKVCEIQSKIEFDHDEAAWLRFIEKVRRPFFVWAGGTPE